MTDAQHAEIMATLRALARQGQAVREELAKLSADVGNLEALIHAVNMRFDEL
jgi:hypothetical protein